MEWSGAARSRAALIAAGVASRLIGCAASDTVTAREKGGASLRRSEGKD